MPVQVLRFLLSVAAACSFMTAPAFAQGGAGGQGIRGMSVLGYPDRFSVQPGETIRFMVSSDLPRFRSDIVRLVHADTNPKGPGFKEELVETPANKEYPGKRQELRLGSYIQVPDHSALRLTGSFTIQAWVYPTAPMAGTQAIVSKWSGADRAGYGLFVDDDGSLALWLADKGRVEKVKTGQTFPFYRRMERPNPSREALHAGRWVFVAATFDASNGKVTLYQEPVVAWPVLETPAIVDRTVALRSVGATAAPLLIGAAWDSHDGKTGRAGSVYNGKIESPRLFNRALSRQELASLKSGGAPEGAVASWDFAADIGSRNVSDTSANKLDGRTVNMPTRAVTGRNWNAREPSFAQARSQYGAIHFHDDDLDDAGWDPSVEFIVPQDLRSGIYAARLRAGNAEDYVPFFVRPKKGAPTARIAFLVPTFSYLAYGNSGIIGRDPLSLGHYDHHNDGSGVSYSSRLRPILSIRPKILSSWGNSPRHFAADIYMAYFMEQKGHKYDVITDEDLNAEGVALLKPYKVIVSGSHPEYWTTPMMEALETYQNSGGRFMYMGGNGFYWVTSLDSEQKHTVEVRRWGGTQGWEAEPGEYYHSTTGELGGLWRFRGRAPQKMVGIGFASQGPGPNLSYVRQTSSFDPRAAFIFEGVGPNERIGDHPSLVRGYGAAGDEVDRFDQQVGTPSHALLLATATGFDSSYAHVVEEVHSSNSGPVHDLERADMTYFEYPNGGAMFSVGSISWFGALSYNNFDNTTAKVTNNVLSKFASDDPLPPAAGR